jgi:hypothetical protein
VCVDVCRACARVQSRKRVRAANKLTFLTVSDASKKWEEEEEADNAKRGWLGAADDRPK